MITHYDLFAGIGGFSLALEEVFSDATIKHIFCEWERFPTAVLKQHWPDGEYWGDIADLVANTQKPGLESGRQRKVQKGRPESPYSFTIVTGGFPCQPFSHAGRRKGTADDRYQWPNMFAIIRSVKPEWVVAENVRGLATWNDGMVLEQVCSDLESQGYEVQPFIIPAVAVNAPHKRDRIWIIAHSERNGQPASKDAGISNETPRQESARPQRAIDAQGASGVSGDIADTGGAQPHGVSDPVGQKVSTDWGASWRRDWREVALATCNASMDDGLPRIVDGVPVSFSAWRRDSIKAYGNGIVHQVAIQIMDSIRIALDK